MLGYHQFDSTYAEREFLMASKKEEYEILKAQWQVRVYFSLSCLISTLHSILFKNYDLVCSWVLSFVVLVTTSHLSIFILSSAGRSQVVCTVLRLGQAHANKYILSRRCRLSKLSALQSTESGSIV